METVYYQSPAFAITNFKNFLIFSNGQKLMINNTEFFVPYNIQKIKTHNDYIFIYGKFFVLIILYDTKVSYQSKIVSLNDWVCDVSYQNGEIRCLTLCGFLYTIEIGIFSEIEKSYSEIQFVDSRIEKKEIVKNHCNKKGEFNTTESGNMSYVTNPYSTKTNKVNNCHEAKDEQVKSEENYSKNCEKESLIGISGSFITLENDNKCLYNINKTTYNLKDYEKIKYRIKEKTSNFNFVCGILDPKYLFISGSWDGTLRTKNNVYKLHNGTIYEVHFSSNYLLTCSTDRTVKVINYKDFSIKYEQVDYRNRVFKCGFIFDEVFIEKITKRYEMLKYVKSGLNDRNLNFYNLNENIDGVKINEDSFGSFKDNNSKQSNAVNNDLEKIQSCPKIMQSEKIENMIGRELNLEKKSNKKKDMENFDGDEKAKYNKNEEGQVLKNFNDKNKQKGINDISLSNKLDFINMKSPDKCKKDLHDVIYYTINEMGEVRIFKNNIIIYSYRSCQQSLLNIFIYEGNMYCYYRNGKIIIKELEETEFVCETQGFFVTNKEKMIVYSNGKLENVCIDFSPRNIEFIDNLCFFTNKNKLYKIFNNTLIMVREFPSAIIKLKKDGLIFSEKAMLIKNYEFNNIITYNIKNIVCIFKEFLGTREGYLIYHNLKIKVSDFAITGIVYKNIDSVYISSRDGRVYLIEINKKAVKKYKNVIELNEYNWEDLVLLNPLDGEYLIFYKQLSTYFLEDIFIKDDNICSLSFSKNHVHISTFTSKNTIEISFKPKRYQITPNFLYFMKNNFLLRVPLYKNNFNPTTHGEYNYSFYVKESEIYLFATSYNILVLDYKFNILDSFECEDISKMIHSDNNIFIGTNNSEVIHLVLKENRLIFTKKSYKLYGRITALCYDKESLFVFDSYGFLFKFLLNLTLEPVWVINTKKLVFDVIVTKKDNLIFGDSTGVLNILNLKNIDSKHKKNNFECEENIDITRDLKNVEILTKTNNYGDNLNTKSINYRNKTLESKEESTNFVDDHEKMFNNQFLIRSHKEEIKKNEIDDLKLFKYIYLDCSEIKTSKIHHGAILKIKSYLSESGNLIITSSDDHTIGIHHEEFYNKENNLTEIIEENTSNMKEESLENSSNKNKINKNHGNRPNAQNKKNNDYSPSLQECKKASFTQERKKSNDIYDDKNKEAKTSNTMDMNSKKNFTNEKKHESISKKNQIEKSNFENKIIYSQQIEEGKNSIHINLHNSMIKDFIYDGQKILSIGKDKKLKLYNLKTKEVVEKNLKIYDSKSILKVNEQFYCIIGVGIEVVDLKFYL